MKIEFFTDNKWEEVDGYDFDDFMEQVVNEEVPFRFVDCAEDEINNFTEYCKSESAGLDDYEYYRIDFFFDTPNEIYIYNDDVCYVFEDYVANVNYRAEKANTILNNIKKVE